jgi:hypothetical protein
MTIMLIRTYQLAITGSRRAGKRIVKMILEREKLHFKSRALDGRELRAGTNGWTLRMRWRRSKSSASVQGRRVRTQVIAEAEICALNAGRWRRP